MQDIVKPKSTVLILGYPRSGTTWISNIVNAHPDILYRHELFGRCYEAFGSQLFSALKYDNGLSDSDYLKALKVALQARPESDRPPFFQKSCDRRRLMPLRKPLWMLSQSFRGASKLYSQLYSPTDVAKLHLVIKETRSSVNLPSIVNGIRAETVLILLRHPYSVVASHVSGQRKGVMQASGKQRREEWFGFHRESAYLNKTGIGVSDIVRMSEVEFLAIDWLVQNSNYREMCTPKSKTNIFIYEEFLADPRNRILDLYSALDLDVVSQVESFVSASTTSHARSMFERDSSDGYFSVYRAPSFDPMKWKQVLSHDDIRAIDRHCATFVQQTGLANLNDR